MKNVGNIDRAVRYALAAGLIAAGILAGAGTTRYVLWGISLAPILTGTFRFCPVWLPFHINTYKK